MEITVRLLQEEPTLFQSVIDFIQDPSAWLSIISAVIAIVALLQTQSQIKLSNKQQLFDRRLKVYWIIREIVESCRQYNEFCFSKNIGYPLFMVELDYKRLTSNAYMNEVSGAIDRLDDDNESRKLSDQLNEVGKISAECELLFPKEISAPLTGLIFCYRNLLQKLCFYHSVMYKARSTTFQIDTEEIKFPKTMEYLHEAQYREEVFQAQNRLKSAFKAWQEADVEEKIKDCIRL